MARFVFITGGVVSSLGKGLASAALGALLDPHVSVPGRRQHPVPIGIEPAAFQTGSGYMTARNPLFERRQCPVVWPVV